MSDFKDMFVYSATLLWRHLPSNVMGSEAKLVEKCCIKLLLKWNTCFCVNCNHSNKKYWTAETNTQDSECNTAKGFC